MIAWHMMRGTVQNWVRGRGFQYAASLAFYTLVSLAPTVLIVVGIAGLFFGQEIVRSELLKQIQSHVTTDVAAAIQGVVENAVFGGGGLIATVVGIVIMMFGATTAFANLNNGLNSIWSVQWDPEQSQLIAFLKTRLFSLSAVFFMGLLLILVVLVNLTFENFRIVLELSFSIPHPLSLALMQLSSITLFFFLILILFRILPAVRLRWTDLCVGAGFTAILFAFGKYLISLYLGMAINSMIFGAAGSLVILLFWVYYSSLILFLGAAFTRAYVTEMDHPIPLAHGAVQTL